MTTIWLYDDGGRETAGFEGKTGDCVTRAIAIALKLPYQGVYSDLWGELKEYTAAHRDRVAKRIARGGGRLGTTPRNGIARPVYESYLLARGWIWHPTMRIGSGCKVHLCHKELPSGRLIVSLSRHLCAVIDGTIHDTYDPSRDGRRCVYGYYSQS